MIRSCAVGRADQTYLRRLGGEEVLTTEQLPLIDRNLAKTTHWILEASAQPSRLESCCRSLPCKGAFACSSRAAKGDLQGLARRAAPRVVCGAVRRDAISTAIPSALRRARGEARRDVRRVAGREQLRDARGDARTGALLSALLAAKPKLLPMTGPSLHSSIWIWQRISPGDKASFLALPVASQLTTHLRPHRMHQSESILRVGAG